MNIHKITLVGVLIAGAVVIGYLESLIPSVGIPGIKLGLANIVILITLYELGIKEAIFVNALRVVLVSLITGTLFSYGFLMSLAGAILSLGVMVLFHTLIKKFSIIGVSVLGALFHVIGQIIVAMIFLESVYVLYYLPFIAVTSLITGVLVGLGSQLIIKTGAIKKIKEKYNF